VHRLVQYGYLEDLDDYFILNRGCKISGKKIEEIFEKIKEDWSVVEVVEG
jgi:hypothetical protein